MQFETIKDTLHRHTVRECVYCDSRLAKGLQQPTPPLRLHLLETVKGGWGVASKKNFEGLLTPGSVREKEFNHLSSSQKSTSKGLITLNAFLHMHWKEEGCEGATTKRG